MTFSMPPSTSRSSTAADLVLAGADAGQVRHRGQARLALDPLHQIDGLRARRAARAVGHRHVRRRQLGQLADRPLQRLHARVGLGREELEREQPPVVAENSSEIFIWRPLDRCCRTSAHAVEVRRDRRGVDCHGLALAFGRLEHDVVADLLDDGAQAARAGAPPQAILRRWPATLVGEAQVDAVDLQQRLILAHDRVGRAGHDQVEIVLGQRFVARRGRAAAPGTRRGSRSRAAPSR